MKKKGLIISTVVMVVVLIASLTTATYAWFNTSSSVKVNSIDLSVKSSANVKVGVKNVFDGSVTGYNAYLNESVGIATGTTGNTVAWEGDTLGLGSVLNFEDLALGGDKAVGTGTPTVKTGDEVTTPGTADAPTKMLDANGTDKYIIAAKGNGASVDSSSVVVANANKDYLDATIGMEANQEGIKGLYVKVEVTTNDTGVTLGVCASIHFIVVINGTSYEFEPFGENTTTGDTISGTTKDTPKSATTANSMSWVTYDDGTKQLKSTFYFWVSTSDTALGQNATAIKDFRILAYIDGADVDCAERVTGGCTIDISFDGTKDTTKIKDENGTDIAVDANMKFLNTTDSVKVTA